MKRCFTIGFLFFVITQIIAQKPIDIEAINFYVSNNTPKENERLVNDIYLQKVALGHQSFSPMQTQILCNIAHQCPELGGTAVYRARSIYDLIDVEIYNDNCPSLPHARMAGVDSCHLDVHFKNPSLEGTLGFNTAPYQWNICNFSPDIHPFWSGDLPPSHGLSYVGVAVSGPPNNHPVESIGSILIDSLEMGERYKFLIDFTSYASWSPGSITIWLGNSLCNRDQLIYAGVTQDTLWNTHLVNFVPNDNYSHVIISSELVSNVNRARVDNLRPAPQPFGCDTVTSINSLPPDKTDNTGNGVYTNVTTTEPSEFKVYPNPNTQGILMVEWTTPIQNGKLVLIDAIGRQVGEYVVGDNSMSQQIDIQRLPSGYYTILLETDKQVWGREKLIVIKQ